MVEIKNLNDLNIKLFADGANYDDIISHNDNPIIKGFTTNPTLMKKAGIEDYEDFSRKILAAIKNKPISLEVFADDIKEMFDQANVINSWGKNVYVKIPIMNTKEEKTLEIIKDLMNLDVKLNITAIMTLKQVEELCKIMNKTTPIIISVFAGRVADTGVDPVPHMRESKAMLSDFQNAELLWASPRELLNLFHAESVNCDIITATSDILNKIKLLNKDLYQYSRETVEMFRTDAVSAGYKIKY